MSTTRKTSKEIESEAATARRERNVARAKEALLGIRNQQAFLRNFSKMGKLIGDMQEHVNWLIAEDESYARAAAELFAELSGTGGVQGENSAMVNSASPYPPGVNPNWRD